MKLFGYYALHSFLNQIRKLLKSWVIIFILACILIGGCVGFLAGTLAGEVEDSIPEEEIWEEEAAEEPSFFESQGIGKQEMLELILGAAALAILAFQALGADKSGGRIFLPADVNLLFSSPMTPQSVLMFRLTTQMGAAVFLGIYMLIQIPNMINLFGTSVPGAIAVLLDFGFAFGLGSLIKVLLYLLYSRSDAFRKNFSRGFYAFLAAIAAAFFLFWKRRGGGVLPAAIAFFNAPLTRWIPIWGWLKGFPMWADEGNLPLCLFTAALMVLGAALLLLIIRRTEADFYEDAMAKSEEIAAKLEQAKASQSGRVGMKHRSKDRSDRLKRDGLNRGAGASMFFCKTMYNRFRFAHFGFLTKTMETYLVVGLAAAALTRFFLQSQAVYGLVLGIAVLVFFRALGNPLEQDVKMGYFILIPEGARKKLAWSLLGSSLCCLLDCLPGLILGSLLLGGGDPLIILHALCWLPFLLSLDLFSTTVGTFIDLSVPINSGVTIKQFIQIMFIYFGIVPDAGILAVGFVYGHVFAAAAGAALMNLLLALIFFLLAAGCLEPSGGRSVIRDSQRTGDPREAKKVFSRIGFSAVVLLAAASCLQILISFAIKEFAPALTDSELALWLITFVPIYCVGVPLALLVLRGVPASAPEKSGLGPKGILKAFLISIFGMYAGNLVGTLIVTLLQYATGLESANAVYTYATSSSLPLKVFFLVICAPMIEEYIFRKRFIDAMRPYGGSLAVVTSAAMFGLFHGNLSQLFYAFALGLVFGYVYLRTGRLRYTIGLHMSINLIGTVISPEILNLLYAETDSGMYAYAAYVIGILICAVAGLILLISGRRQITFSAGEKELPRGTRFSAAWISPGMLLFTAGCLGLILYAIVG